ncbi:MAG: divergent PAP2 family protein [Patescibacteria group bacterium]|nr:divergent PAP2 family protein [Patescibacteria group bacterium]
MILGLSRLSQIRGEAEHLAEGVVRLRRGQSAGFNKEVGQTACKSRRSLGQQAASAKVLNMIIIIPVVAWLFGQVLKFLWHSGPSGRFKLEALTAYGGMPSTHSIMVASLATIVGLTQGVASPLFGVTVVSALFVISDALKLRNALASQSRIVNALRKLLPEDRRKLFETAPEQLGHTFPEILVGLAIGCFLTLVLYQIMKGWNLIF